MKSIIPTYLLIAGLAVMMVVGMSLVSLQIQMTNARSFHTEALDVIQSSNYSQDVEDYYKTQAGSFNDGELEIEHNVTLPDTSRKANKVTFTFKPVVQFLGTSTKTVTISAYGR